VLRSLDADRKMIDPHWASYLLATIKHEVANTWQPIKERGSDAYFVRRYWTNEKVRLLLGNRSPEDAIRFCGHGYTQLTGRRNFTLFSQLLWVDLVKTPELALDHGHAYQIISLGMRQGRFTGRALRHYLNNE
jgi:putative chitinase